MKKHIMIEGISRVKPVLSSNESLPVSNISHLPVLRKVLSWRTMSISTDDPLFTIMYKVGSRVLHALVSERDE